ncbi:MAG: DUF6497 family protein [Paracoccaceae bacterium]
MSDATPIPVPSGQPVTFHEVLTDQPGQGLAYRFRFVAPDIARDKGQADFELIGRDMEFLCNSYALPRIANGGPVPNQIIISLADRPTVFGEPDPDATQFFEAYSVDGDACMWEPF